MLRLAASCSSSVGSPVSMKASRPGCASRSCSARDRDSTQTSRECMKSCVACNGGVGDVPKSSWTWVLLRPQPRAVTFMQLAPPPPRSAAVASCTVSRLAGAQSARKSSATSSSKDWNSLPQPGCSTRRRTPKYLARPASSIRVAPRATKRPLMSSSVPGSQCAAVSTAPRETREPVQKALQPQDWAAEPGWVADSARMQTPRSGHKTSSAAKGYSSICTRSPSTIKRRLGSCSSPTVRPKMAASTSSGSSICCSAGGIRSASCHHQLAGHMPCQSQGGRGAATGPRLATHPP
mmetsp:Transcript_113656/g.352986  ORF Transcript_113656/g.352986 Transcript_113656/m.352986 type:complete len:293 (+) Transcript_113656:1132-2010(+)